MDKVQIQKTDDVCHWVLDPKHFIGGPGCLNLNIDVHFNSHSAHPYHMSVNSRELCKDYPKDIHDGGYKFAQIQTERHLKKGKERHEKYVGFKSAKVEGVNSISYENHFLVVEHAPINDNYAHCNIALKFPNELKKPKPGIRNKIVEDLRECFSEPVVTPK